jgi:hypothetical protein
VNKNHYSSGCIYALPHGGAWLHDGQVLADHDTWSNPQLQALVQTHARLIQEYRCVERQPQGPALVGALGAGTVGVGGCARLRWSVAGVRSVSSALICCTRALSAVSGRRPAPRPRGRRPQPAGLLASLSPPANRPGVSYLRRDCRSRSGTGENELRVGGWGPLQLIQCVTRAFRHGFVRIPRRFAPSWTQTAGIPLPRMLYTL